MRVLIVGGTGFLGYYVVRELVKRGHQVRVLALPPTPAEGLLPPQVEVRLANLDELADAEVRALLAGMEGAIFAAGADDRVIPPAPAYPFFKRANVEASARFFRLARDAGVTRGVLLSSYFAHFAQAWPALKLAEHHPYIRSRVEQEAAALHAALPSLQLAILQLPYIFGAMPGRVPLWAPLVNLVRASRVLFYPRGGTNMVAVQHVGEAIVGALERGAGGERYLVGDENLTWRAFLKRMSRQAVGRARPVITIPDALLKTTMRKVRAQHRADGKEAGLHEIEFVKLQTAETYFDPEPTRQALGYGSGGLDEALRDTVAACPPGGKTTLW
ncbi:MAG: NAD(P)H-binding protein [Chloroflexi bacterium]|nr:NAD(P)H-binding protein [Chloroflexota bacterium]